MLLKLVMSFSGSNTSPSRCGAKSTCRKVLSSKVSNSLYSDKYFTAFTECIITSLRRGKPDFGYVAEIYALLRLPQVVVMLEGKPTLRRAAQRLGKPQRHFGAYA